MKYILLSLKFVDVTFVIHMSTKKNSIYDSPYKCCVIVHSSSGFNFYFVFLINALELATCKSGRGGRSQIVDIAGSVGGF